MTKKQQKEMADRIKKRRESLGYTQEGFCEAIGLSVSSYTKIENAFQQPSLDTVIKIAQRLDISIDYLVAGLDKDRPQKPNQAEKIHALLNGADGGKLLYASEVFAKIAKTVSE